MELNNRFFDQVDTSIFGPPPMAGVYAVCIKSHLSAKERILYIGSSKNMKRRLLGKRHPYMVLFRRFSRMYVYTRCFTTTDFLRIERALIQVYNPLINLQYK